MRTTSAISFYCRESKKDRNGYAPLECSVTICGERRFLNLPMKFKPQDFNKKRPSNEIVETMDLWRGKINSYMVELMKVGKPITSEILRRAIQEGGVIVRPYTIGDLFDDYLAILRKRVGIDLRITVYRKYELTAIFALKYARRDDEIEKLTPHTIKTIEVALRARYDPSTVAGYLTRLKTFTRFAIDNGKLQINPFQNIRIVKPIKPIKALEEAEVKHLLTLSLEPRLQRVLDLFLIQCGTGMAYSDLMDFEINDMKKEGDWYYISKPRNKTGRVFTALVLPWAVPIIFHYGVLGKISNQVYNRYLKEVDGKLTSHMGRRTYASILANNNVSMEVVAAALGDNQQVTARYYAKILDKTVIRQQISALQ